MGSEKNIRPRDDSLQMTIVKKNFGKKVHHLYNPAVIFTQFLTYMLSNLIPDLLKAEEYLHNEFAKLQVGRANPAIVE